MSTAFVALFVLSTVLLLSASARADPSPTPNGYCGALNMVMDPTMLTTAMVHDAAQGTAGMFTAVTASSCS